MKTGLIGSDNEENPSSHWNPDETTLIFKGEPKRLAPG